MVTKKIKPASDEINFIKEALYTILVGVEAYTYLDLHEDLNIDKSFATKIYSWYEQEKERYEKEIDKVRRAALAKLSPQEIKALGIEDE